MKSIYNLQIPLFLFDLPRLLQCCLSYIFLICLLRGLYMFTICLQKHSSHLKILGIKCYQAPEVMRKVNIEDASFVRFSE